MYKEKGNMKTKGIEAVSLHDGTSKVLYFDQTFGLLFYMGWRDMKPYLHKAFFTTFKVQYTSLYFRKVIAFAHMLSWFDFKSQCKWVQIIFNSGRFPAGCSGIICSDLGRTLFWEIKCSFQLIPANSADTVRQGPVKLSPGHYYRNCSVY